MRTNVLQPVLTCLIFIVICNICNSQTRAETEEHISTPGEPNIPLALPPTKLFPEATAQPPQHSALSQIPAVSQLSDVAPTDWEYQVLGMLIERYDCGVGGPDHRYRGDRRLTRAEFAVGLQVCLDRVSTLMLNPEAVVPEADLVALQRLQAEFTSDMKALQSRVDRLETTLTAIEAAQFSPIAQLNILSSFNIAQTLAAGDILAEGIPVPDVRPAARLAARTVDPETGQLVPVVGTVSDNRPPVTFSQATYLIFTASRTGEDLLTAILAAGNGNPPASTFSSAGFTSTFGIPYTDSNPVPPLEPDQLGLLELKYSFPLTDTLQLTLGPRILPFRHFDTNLYTDVIRGASGLNFYQSTLANSGLTGAGAIADWVISPELTLKAGFLARNDAALTFYGGGNGPSNPKRGLFEGTNSILTELTYSPSPDVNLRVFYGRDHLDAPPPGPFGAAVSPFFLSSLRGVVDDGAGGSLNDVIQNNFVFNFDWLLAPQVALFGRYSYSVAEIDPVNPEISGGQVDLQAFQLGLAFPDLGRESALATLAAVIPFDVVSGRRFLVGGNGDGGTEIDLEAVYSYPISDQITIVPTFFVIFNPNNFDENPPLYSATLRLQFLF